MQQQKLIAEAVGTFGLVLIGCGAAVLASGFSPIAIGLLGVSFAFGLAVLAMAYAVGHISGGHFNPAVTVGLIIGGRFDAKEAAGYIIAQLVGAAAAAAVLFVVASGADGFDVDAGFAANGYDAHSPGGYSLAAALVLEVTLTALFLVVIMGGTDRLAPQGMAPAAIGLALVMIHLVAIPVTNCSVNPARSTSQALFVGGWALEQLWLFWVAPIGGAIIGAAIYRYGLQEQAAPLTPEAVLEGPGARQAPPPPPPAR